MKFFMSQRIVFTIFSLRFSYCLKSVEAPKHNIRVTTIFFVKTSHGFTKKFEFRFGYTILRADWEKSNSRHLPHSSVDVRQLTLCYERNAIPARFDTMMYSQSPYITGRSGSKRVLHYFLVILPSQFVLNCPFCMTCTFMQITQP